MFLITISAKALRRQLFRSLCYLHGGPPADLPLSPSPSEGRLSGCPFHICLRDLFLGFLLHFTPPPLPRKQDQRHVGGSRREVGCLPLILLCPLPPASAAFPGVLPREQMDGGCQGPVFAVPAPIREKLDLDTTEAQGSSTPQTRQMARPHLSANRQLAGSSSQDLLLLMPPALVLPHKTCTS